MKNWSRIFGITAVTAVAVALLSSTGTGSAVAQGVFKPLMALIVNDASNPVPVQDVNARHRTLFSDEQEGVCDNYYCVMDFPEVPEGKRLVILHVGAWVRHTTPSTPVDYATLANLTREELLPHLRNYFPMIHIGQVGDTVAGDTYGMNQPVLAYVEPGEFARVQTVNRDYSDIGYARATISGYFVDVE